MFIFLLYIATYCVYLIVFSFGAAIVSLKEELFQCKKTHMEPVLEEFLPLKTTCDEAEKDDDATQKEMDSRDKKNWLSSVKLWNNSDNLNQNSNLLTENNKVLRKCFLFLT